MNAPNHFLEEAIPHEAGHILIGKLNKLPIRGLTVLLVGFGSSLQLHSFGTASYDPPDNDIPRLKPDLRMALLRMIAGGYGGQLFADIPISGVGANDDRDRFYKISSPGSELTLEELANEIQPAFYDHEAIFRELSQLIRERSTQFLKRTDLVAGRHILLTETELEPVLKKLSTE